MDECLEVGAMRMSALGASSPLKSARGRRPESRHAELQEGVANGS